MRRAALMFSAVFLSLLPILAQAAPAGARSARALAGTTAYDISYPSAGRRRRVSVAPGSSA